MVACGSQIYPATLAPWLWQKLLQECGPWSAALLLAALQWSISQCQNPVWRGAALPKPCANRSLGTNSKLCVMFHWTGVRSGLPLLCPSHRTCLHTAEIPILWPVYLTSSTWLPAGGSKESAFCQSSAKNSLLKSNQVFGDVEVAHTTLRRTSRGLIIRAYLWVRSWAGWEAWYGTYYLNE